MMASTWGIPAILQAAMRSGFVPSPILRVRYPSQAEGTNIGGEISFLESQKMVHVCELLISPYRHRQD